MIYLRVGSASFEMRTVMRSACQIAKLSTTGAILMLHSSSSPACTSAAPPQAAPQSAVTSINCTLLGTGSSNSVPSLGCLCAHRGQPAPCTVCKEASENPLSKNCRDNPSLLIQLAKSDGTEPTNILVSGP